MKVDKYDSNGGDLVLTAGAWSGWTSGMVEVGAGVDSESQRDKASWEAPSQVPFGTAIATSASITEDYRFNIREP